MTAQSLIANNPYRILGVYVDDSPAREAGNKSRIAAYSTVGQSATFSLEGDDKLPGLRRTEEMAAEAAQSISLPNERLHFGLAWFSLGKEPWSRCLNEAVDALIADNFTHALKCYDKLICDDVMRVSFSSKVTHGLVEASQEELAELLADMLLPVSGLEDLAGFNDDIMPFGCAGEAVVRRIIERDLISSFSQIGDLSINAYDSAEGLFGILSEIEPHLRIVRRNLGNNHPLYRECVETLANYVYKNAQMIVKAIGGWAWNAVAHDYSKGLSWPIRITDRDSRSFEIALSKIRRFTENIEKFISGLDMSESSFGSVMLCKYEFDKEVAAQLSFDPNASKIIKRKRIWNRIYATMWIAFLMFLFTVV